MFNRRKGNDKKQTSERRFICSAVEELLRAELKLEYGESVFLYNSFAVAERETLKTFEQDVHTDETDVERAQYYNQGTLERRVRIKVLVGGLLPKQLVRLEVACRLYSTNTNTGYWPHFLRVIRQGENGPSTSTFVYAHGYIEGIPYRKTADAPCQEMFSMQLDSNGTKLIHEDAAAWQPLRSC